MKTTKELIIADITAKVEAKLASQKVELALTDDLTKLVGSNKNAISEANRFVDNINVTYNKLYNVVDDIDNMQSYIKSVPGAKNLLGFQNQEFNKILSQIDSQAKSLGLDSKSVKGYSEAKDLIKLNEKYMKELEQSKLAGEKILSQLK
jgi:subtilase family serine protease